MDTPSPIAVSTAWNARRHTSGSAMVQELLDLGFEALELNVHVTEQMIAEVLEMVNQGLVRICSLHNYCPVPDIIDPERAASNVLPLSSTSAKERQNAVAYTKRTIDWAARLGARTVVVHSGYVPVEFRQREAVRLIQEGKTAEAKEIIMGQLMERSMQRMPYLDSLVESLRELGSCAEDAGIKLALENRYYFGEIPTLDEFQLIFKNVNSRALCYWHDTGHAHVMEFLGLAVQEDYLRKYADRMAGVHIHDAAGPKDHLPVGCGDIDFPAIAPYLKQDTEIVLEIHAPATPEELVASKHRIEELLCQAEGHG